MTEIVSMLLFFVAYVVLMKWILPRLGVPT
jgi:hypothetical protein